MNLSLLLLLGCVFPVPVVFRGVIADQSKGISEIKLI